MGTNHSMKVCPLSRHLVLEMVSNIGVSKMERIHPLWSKNEFNKFQGDLPTRFRLCSWHLMKVQHKQKRPPKKSGLLIWGTWTSTMNFMAIYSVGCCHVIFLQTKVMDRQTSWHTDNGLRVEQEKKNTLLSVSVKAHSAMCGQQTDVSIVYSTATLEPLKHHECNWTCLLLG